MGSPAGMAFHFQGTRGPLLGILHQASSGVSGAPKGQVLMLPPWGEELNHTRRLVRQAATRMAEAGWTVLRYDPWGCGDSGGELHEATWQGWQSDALLAWEWLTHHTPSTPHSVPDTASHWVWGIRAGALMATHLLRALNTQPAPSRRPRNVLWWHAILHGKQLVQQWQRQRHAATWTRTGFPTSPLPSAAEPLWLAGQLISTDLMAHMQQCRMPAPPPGTQHLVWLDTAAPEVVASAPGHSPAQEAVLATWQSAGCEVLHDTVAGPSHWLTLGLDSADALLTQTLARMEAAHASH